jgi:molybdopterin-guanine dinucleotide biosynthesis protein A
MLGVILCGGESSRMGADKGLIQFQHKTWTQLAIEKIEELGIPVVVSISSRQKEKYESLLPGNKLIVDDSTIALKGPVAAILNVHLKYPADDLFVLACDLPLMEFSVLDELYRFYVIKNIFQAFVYTNNGAPEPLCGIYTARGLSLINNMYYTQKLEKQSMKYVLDQLSVYSVPIHENKKQCFRNFNSPEDVFLF